MKLDEVCEVLEGVRKNVRAQAGVWSLCTRARKTFFCHLGKSLDMEAPGPHSRAHWGLERGRGSRHSQESWGRYHVRVGATMIRLSALGAQLSPLSIDRSAVAPPAPES